MTMGDNVIYKNKNCNKICMPPSWYISFFFVNFGKKK